MLSFPGISIFGCGKRCVGRFDEPLHPVAGEDELAGFLKDPSNPGLFLIPQEERDRWTDEHCQEIETCFEADGRAAREKRAEFEKCIDERARELARPEISGILRGCPKRKAPSPTQAAAMEAVQKRSLEAARVELLAKRTEEEARESEKEAAPAVDPVQRVALQDVLSRVRLVCHDRFREALERSIMRGVQQIPEFYSRRDAVVLVEPMKSNKWVAQLAFEQGFVGHQYVQLGASHAREFETLFSSDSEFKASLENKVIVLFDDASYSGNQMTGHMQVIARLVEKTKVRALLVIIPFMTDIARRKISAAAQDARDLRVVIEGERMPSLMDVSQPQHRTLQTMWGYVDPGRDVLRDAAGGAAEIPVDGIGLFCFTHKIPNQESFPVALQRGTVCDLGGKPFSRRVSPRPLIDARNFPPPYKRDSGSPSAVAGGAAAAVSAARAGVIADPVFEVSEIRSLSEVGDFLRGLAVDPETVRVFIGLDQTLVQEDPAAGTVQLFELTTLVSLKAIQEKFVVFGCTDRKRDEDSKTIAQLTSLGISLGTEGTRGKKTDFGNFRVCEGVLFADSESPGKGVGIKHGLRKDVRTVIFVDCKKDEVERVCVSMKRERKNFYGFFLNRA